MEGGIGELVFNGIWSFSFMEQEEKFSGDGWLCINATELYTHIITLKMVKIV